jgi:hypothetical protein
MKTSAPQAEERTVFGSTGVLAVVVVAEALVRPSIVLETGLWELISVIVHSAKRAKERAIGLARRQGAGEWGS